MGNNQPIITTQIRRRKIWQGSKLHLRPPRGAVFAQVVIVVIVVVVLCVCGNERVGYDLCVGSHCFGRLRIAGSCNQGPDLHHQTIAGVGKEIDHIIASSTCWSTIENCRVFQSAEFHPTDHTHMLLQLLSFVLSQEESQDEIVQFPFRKRRLIVC